MGVPLNLMRTWRKLLLADQTPLFPLETRLMYYILQEDQAAGWAMSTTPTAGHLPPGTSLIGDWWLSQESRLPVVMDPEAFMTTGIKGIFCESAYTALVTDSPLLLRTEARATTMELNPAEMVEAGWRSAQACLPLP